MRRKSGSQSTPPRRRKENAIAIRAIKGPDPPKGWFTSRAHAGQSTSAVLWRNAPKYRTYAHAPDNHLLHDQCVIRPALM
jgi:hypothetical protein